MRIFSLVFLFCLVACDGQVGGAREADATAEESTPILCLVDGATEFAPRCTSRQSPGERGNVLTVSSPNGGFHRLLITRDGRGVVAADGAEPATVKLLGEDMIEVGIGSDRYRLPATIRPIGEQSR